MLDTLMINTLPPENLLRKIQEGGMPDTAKVSLANAHLRAIVEAISARKTINPAAVAHVEPLRQSAKRT